MSGSRPGRPAGPDGTLIKVTISLPDDVYEALGGSRTQIRKALTKHVRGVPATSLLRRAAGHLASLAECDRDARHMSRALVRLLLDWERIGAPNGRRLGRLGRDIIAAQAPASRRRYRSA